MSNKNQKDRPMFAKMNISGRPTETERQAAVARTRYRSRRKRRERRTLMVHDSGFRVNGSRFKVQW